MVSSDLCLLSHAGAALERSFTFAFRTPKEAGGFLLLSGNEVVLLQTQQRFCFLGRQRNLGAFSAEERAPEWGPEELSPSAVGCHHKLLLMALFFFLFGLRIFWGETGILANITSVH